MIARSMVRYGRYAGLLLLISALGLLAQAPPLQPNRPQHPAVPTVTFTFDWPSIEPHHFVIQVDSSGNAAYESWMGAPSDGQPSAGEPYMLKFTASAAARDRIFSVARRLGYFNGDFEYRKHRVAASGTKTLAYADPNKQYETRYNWSENPGIQQLTALFDGISTTIEAGRRLQHLHRYDRLGLDDELKNLEQLAASHSATELQVIAPVLREIADDNGAMHIARQRAEHLLQVAVAPAQTAATRP